MLEVNIICGTYQTRQKKAWGTKISNFFYSFGFVPLVRQLKVVSLSKLSHKILPGPILSFESINVIISQVSELDRFNIVAFFFPARFKTSFI